ncbi:hypothetical protein ACFYZ5_35405 [Streptomyces chartreusis]|uniref:hypothetical protein n=1 Tax=Streptomyces chartreusis TaxID=1969 RepID=UPI00368A68AE
MDTARTTSSTSSSSTWRMPVLNPIDTDAVIRDGGAHGVFPGAVHEGVAWWIAACFVVITRAGQMAVARDSHPTTAAFHQGFLLGAINAEHYGCQVADLGTADEAQLLTAMRHLGDVPGALLTTTDHSTHEDVSIRLYTADGEPVTEDTGLATVREMICADRVPLPVNARAKGSISERPDLLGAP